MVPNQDIDKQPKGIIDVGCGDGTLISHVYEVILTKTQRGEMIKKYPLFVIGIDFNENFLVLLSARSIF